MLHPDQARATLEKLRDENWHEAHVAAAAKLPKGLREPALALLGCDAKGDEIEDWSARNQATEAAAAVLDALSARQRLQLFAVFFPRLAAQVEAGWQLGKRLPYPNRLDRKAFRAPRHPEWTRPARGDWLTTLIGELQGYNPDVAWVAAWAPHLGGYGDAEAVGILLAAAIDAGGKEGDAAFDILCASARGEHEVGGMGRHVTRALLVASRPDGWEFVEKLLLAAQRQEGLRQTILETIDEAHPEAFRRMLRLLLEHDLARFSSVVRALDVWFGFQWDSVSVRVVNRVLERVVRFLEDPAARQAALADEDAETVYLALWAMAFEDAPVAVPAAARLLADARAEHRFVAAHLLGQIDLPPARKELARALADDDLRVALRALEDCGEESKDLFERIEALLSRLPAKKTHLEPLVWPWQVLTADKQAVAGDLLTHLGDRPPTRLLPHLSLMDSWQRGEAVEQLAGMKKWDAPTRETLFALAGDPSPTVREAALQALTRCKLTAEEAEGIEGLLTRKASDVRRGALGLLLGQPDAAALASADRLLTAPDPARRLAGLELLRQLAEAGRSAAECRRQAEAYRAGRPRLTQDEQKQLTVVLDSGRTAATLDDALGLMDPAQKTKPVPPRKRNVTFITPAAVEILKSLDALIHEHRQTPIQVPDGWTESEEPKYEEILLGTAEWRFPSVEWTEPLDKQLAQLPLRELWEKWWQGRPRNLHDRDGLELLRATLWLERDDDDWKEWQKRSPQNRQALEVLSGGQKVPKLRYGQVVSEVLAWLLRLSPPGDPVETLLDLVETAFALVPADEVQGTAKKGEYDDNWRDGSPYRDWLNLTRVHAEHSPGDWRPEHHVRLFRLLRWFDEPGFAVPRERPEFGEVLAAYKAGGATEADLLDHLLGPRDTEASSSPFDSLSQLTEPSQSKSLDDPPELRGLVDRCRQRVLEIELNRGDTPTAASPAAGDLSSVYGSDTLVRLLQALGEEKFSRGWGYDRSVSRVNVLSHLIEVSYPAEGETPAVFARRMREAGLPERRLVELAFHAPQWVPHVEHALGWDGFAEGVWWFIAHSRGDAGQDYDAWQAMIRERTPLTDDELGEGAVDVNWFRRVHDALGPQRWQALSEAARYACYGLGHKRAQFLTDVLLGQADKKDLVDQIRRKHAREAVRALGLLPLAEGAARARDLLDRYHVLQEYLRYARSLGAMSKEGAVRSAAIGLANLARTAGYVDPVRLEWAMEAQTSGDLAAGPLTATVSGVTVALALDDAGQPEVTVTRAGQPLKAIPPPVKKNAKVAELVARKTELKRQASRVRLSLEAAMCRGDTFTGAELRELFDHPVLAPALSRLVLIGEGIAGYPVKGGQALRDFADKLEPVKKDEALHVAHPFDLLKTKQWHDWQHDCFAREVRQPFKQVFRELYVLTAAEKAEGTVSRRYAAQQVNPRQALALWNSRGWAADPEEGVRRVFHDAGLVARVAFLGGYFTPAEVEGLTVEGVHFTKRGEWKPVRLTQVPPKLFSEVMRDLDLVVSVAHRGGVDPEASASTVEMRASLLRETCTLLKINNVRLKANHALVRGRLGEYTVHLGSAVVHRQPGGALCLVPVHAQHRGRLFLPFADDDPKTAEVLSKVILLARDDQIQDPNILDQIRAR